MCGVNAGFLLAHVVLQVFPHVVEVSVYFTHWFMMIKPVGEILCTQRGEQQIPL